jgi:cytochrome b pre-mRNA-processing protein 3
MDEGRHSPPIPRRTRQWLRGIWPDTGDRARRERARGLYRDLVNQARTLAFYRDLGVPDTPEGRFEVVGLHVALVVRRLKAAGPPAASLAQELFDLMFADLDESLRHIGVGDLTVGKQIKRLAGHFYARLKALDEAFGAEPGTALRAMLRTNVYHGGAAPTEAQLSRLADYLISSEETLRAQPTASVLDGRLHFVPPQICLNQAQG